MKRPLFDHTYATGSRVRVYCGDCRDLAPRIFGTRPDEPCDSEAAHAWEGGPDLIVADPPYGETSAEWDTWPDGWPAVLSRVVKRSGSLWCCGSLRMFMEQAGEFERGGWHQAQDLVWKKHNGSSLRNDRFRRVHEHGVHFYLRCARWGNVYTDVQRQKTYATPPRVRKSKPGHFTEGGRHVTERRRRLATSVIEARSMHGRAQNKTEKPVDWLGPMIEYSCPPGGLILAPFAGAGTVAEIAMRTGRDVVSIELREAQCQKIVQRLSQPALTLR